MKAPHTPLQRKIAKRRQAMLSDPACVKALEKFDLEAFEAEENIVRQHFIGYLSYLNYRHSLILEKARKAKLLPETEACLKLRAEEALADYETIEKSYARVTKALNTSGLGQVVERHFPSLLENFNHDPGYPEVVNTFRDMGATEAQVSWIEHLMAAQKFDVLRFEGGDGTFAGLEHRMQACLENFRQSVKALQARGLVVFEGGAPNDPSGDGSSDGSVVVSGSTDNPVIIIVIVVVAILCFFFCG